MNKWTHPAKMPATLAMNHSGALKPRMQTLRTGSRPMASSDLAATTTSR